MGFGRGATEDEADGSQSNTGYEPSISDTVSQPDFESTSSVGDEEAISIPINQHPALPRDMDCNIVDRKTTEPLTSDKSVMRNGHKPDLERIAVASDLEPSAVKQSTCSLQSEILQQVKGATSTDIPELNGQRSMRTWQGEKSAADPYAEVIESSLTTAPSDSAHSLMFDGMSLSSQVEEPSIISGLKSAKSSAANSKGTEEDVPLRTDSSVSVISSAQTSLLANPSAPSLIPSVPSKETITAKSDSQYVTLVARSAHNEPKPITAAASTVQPLGAQETKLSTDLEPDSKTLKSGGPLISEVSRTVASHSVSGVLVLSCPFKELLAVDLICSHDVFPLSTSFCSPCPVLAMLWSALL